MLDIEILDSFLRVVRDVLASAVQRARWFLAQSVQMCANRQKQPLLRLRSYLAQVQLLLTGSNVTINRFLI